MMKNRIHLSKFLLFTFFSIFFYFLKVFPLHAGNTVSALKENGSNPNEACETRRWVKYNPSRYHQNKLIHEILELTLKNGNKIVGTLKKYEDYPEKIYTLRDDHGKTLEVHGSEVKEIYIGIVDFPSAQEFQKLYSQWYSISIKRDEDQLINQPVVIYAKDPYHIERKEIYQGRISQISRSGKSKIYFLELDAPPHHTIELKASDIEQIRHLASPPSQLERDIGNGIRNEGGLKSLVPPSDQSQ